MTTELNRRGFQQSTSSVDPIGWSPISLNNLPSSFTLTMADTNKNVGTTSNYITNSVPFVINQFVSQTTGPAISFTAGPSQSSSSGGYQLNTQYGSLFHMFTGLLVLGPVHDIPTDFVWKIYLKDGTNDTVALWSPYSCNGPDCSLQSHDNGINTAISYVSSPGSFVGEGGFNRTPASDGSVPLQLYAIPHVFKISPPISQSYTPAPIPLGLAPSSGLIDIKPPNFNSKNPAYNNFVFVPFSSITPSNPPATLSGPLSDEFAVRSGATSTVMSWALYDSSVSQVNKTTPLTISSPGVYGGVFRVMNVQSTGTPGNSTNMSGYKDVYAICSFNPQTNSANFIHTDNNGALVLDNTLTTKPPDSANYAWKIFVNTTYPRYIAIWNGYPGDGVGTWVQTTLSGQYRVGTSPGLVFTMKTIFNAPPSPAPLMGLSPAPLMGPSPAPLMGLSPAPLMGLSPASLMGPSPAPQAIPYSTTPMSSAPSSSYQTPSFIPPVVVPQVPAQATPDEIKQCQEIIKTCPTNTGTTSTYTMEGSPFDSPNTGRHQLFKLLLAFLIITLAIIFVVKD